MAGSRLLFSMGSSDDDAAGGSAGRAEGGSGLARASIQAICSAVLIL